MKKTGFMPLSTIRISLFRPSINLNINNTLRWDIEVHMLVRSTGELTYQYLRIKVPTELHIDNWFYLCGNYFDPLILYYLEYGFLLCIDKTKLHFTEQFDNHHSATSFSDDMGGYFTTEEKHKAIVGSYNK